MRALLVQPEFPITYWGFQYGLPLTGTLVSLPPLGLLSLAALLFLTDRHSKRFDFTEAQLHSLSEASLEVLSRIPAGSTDVLAYAVQWNDAEGAATPTVRTSSRRKAPRSWHALDTLAAISLSHGLSAEVTKPFACELCDFRASQAGALRTHMRTHTGERPFACELCDYRASEAGHLRGHMRTHTGEKPFACELCDYRASQAGHLRTHVRDAHSRDR